MSRARTPFALALALSLFGCDEPRDDGAPPESPRAAAREATEGATVERRVEAAAAVPSAEDHPMDPHDEAITRAIRQRIVDDHDLSLGAQSVVVVTRGSVVTLRGDVASDAERSTIEGYARAAEGVTRVDDLLAVAN